MTTFTKIWVPVVDLTDDELLTLIIEEAGEIVQAGTKIDRFGADEYFDGLTNFEALIFEFADLRELANEITRRHGYSPTAAPPQKNRLVKRPVSA